MSQLRPSYASSRAWFIRRASSLARRRGRRRAGRAPDPRSLQPRDRRASARCADAAQPAPTAADAQRSSSRRTSASSAAIPTSGYSDNALWQGGRPAHAARSSGSATTPIAQTGDAAARRCCATDYPSSPLVPRGRRRHAARSWRTRQPRRPAIAGRRRRRSRPCAGAPLAAAEPVEPNARRLAVPRRDAPTGRARSAAIKRTALPDGVRVTIELDGEVAYRAASGSRTRAGCSSTCAARTTRRAARRDAQVRRRRRAGDSRSGGIRRTRRASCWTRKASTATACSRSTTRTASSSTSAPRRAAGAGDRVRARRRLSSHRER